MIKGWFKRYTTYPTYIVTDTHDEYEGAYDSSNNSYKWS